jgi:hypothetical protein
VAYTRGKAEEVEVPAGKFEAVRVEGVVDLGTGRTQKSVEWHAVGVGVVKLVVDRGGGEQTTVLKSFTPGKGEVKKGTPPKDE